MSVAQRAPTQAASQSPGEAVSNLLLHTTRVALGSISLDHVYGYSPLENSPTATRLLTLLPGKRADPIRIFLHDVDLKTPTSYEALSYAWGDEMDRRKIFCDGKVIYVTKNLEAAILQLRQEKTARVLWIDAICINQTSVEEKNHQVTMMGTIYQEAEKVIVWLGEEDDDTPQLHRFMHAAITQESSGSWSSYKPATAEFGRLLQIPEAEIKRIIFAFLRRPWFRRMWVVQEFVLAKVLEMWIGSYRIDAEETSVIFTRHFFGWEIAQENRTFMGLMRLRKQRTTTSHPLILAHVNRDRNCKDSRDKVYAILGMSHPEFSKIIVPDYAKPVRDVYVEFASLCLTRRYGLLALSMAGMESVNTDIVLPTWVPNWRDPKSFNDIAAEYKRKAAWGTKASVSSVVGSEELHVRGNIIDVVDSVCEVYWRMSDGPLSDSKAAECLHSWASFVLDRLEQLKKIANGDNEILIALGEMMTWKALKADGGKNSNDHIKLLAAMHAVSAHKSRPGSPNSQRLQERSQKDNIDYGFIKWTTAHPTGRRLYVTREGRMGIGPLSLQPGDITCLFYGGSYVYSLRPEGTRFLFVGDGYLHGVMNGEGVDQDKARDFILI